MDWKPDFFVRILSSVGRNEADAQGDVDFFVDMEVGCSPFDLGGLLLELQGLLGGLVDIVT